jgi:indolepyruvate ferredoxin oxidoreductase alpha subunit
LGASIGLAAGAALAEPGPKVIALAGDSSFLHHSWGGLVEAVRNEADLLVIILDNSTTAMSGRQPHAGTAYNARQVTSTSLDVALLVRAAGVKRMSVIDPLDGAQTRRAIQDALDRKGLDVIISRSPCTLMDRVET